jgi:single-stranded DNA-binding protein
MSLSILAQGTLTRDPDQRTSKSGKTFVTAQLRTPTEEDSVLISVICFDAAGCSKLERLKKGDAVAITGRAKPTTWEKSGEQHHGLSVVASGVLTTYEAGKRRGTRDKPVNGSGLPESDLSDMGAPLWTTN